MSGAGEPPEVSALRELEEELGISLISLELDEENLEEIKRGGKGGKGESGSGGLELLFECVVATDLNRYIHVPMA